MGYTQVNSSSGVEGELKGDLLPGHGPEGVFQSLKGPALTPPELSYDVQDHNDGPDRLNQEVPGSEWTHFLVSGGEFDPNKTTGPGGTLAK